MQGIKNTALACLLGLGMASSGWAGGIPTYDAINYSQLFKQLDEMQQQGMQRLKQYDQVLAHYETQLENWAGLPTHIRDNLLANIEQDLKRIRDEMGPSLLGTLPKLDVESENYEDAVDAVLKTVLVPPPKEDEVQAILDGSSTLSEEHKLLILDQAIAHRTRYEAINDSLAMQSVANEGAKEREKRAEYIAKKVGTLGDNSEVQSLQLILMQNLIVMEQLEETIKGVNQTAVNVTAMERKMLTEVADYQMRDVQRAIHASKQVINNSGMTQWGSL